jgi:hypothetical protein
LNFNISGKLAEELKKTFDCTIVATIHCLDWCLLLFGNVTRLRKILSDQKADCNDESKKTIYELFRKEKDFFETRVLMKQSIEIYKKMKQYFTDENLIMIDATQSLDEMADIIITLIK